MSNEIQEALDRVRALHHPAQTDVEPWAAGYRFTGYHCTHDGQHWPCDTIAVLEATK